MSLSSRLCLQIIENGVLSIINIVVCGSLWFVLFSLCFNSQPNIECRLIKSNKEMRETCHLDESRGNELRMISTCVHRSSKTAQSHV